MVTGEVYSPRFHVPYLDALPDCSVRLGCPEIDGVIQVDAVEEHTFTGIAIERNGDVVAVSRQDGAPLMAEITYHGDYIPKTGRYTWKERSRIIRDPVAAVELRQMPGSGVHPCWKFTGEGVRVVDEYGAFQFARLVGLFSLRKLNLTEPFWYPRPGTPDTTGCES